MNPLVQQALGSLIRFGLAVGAGYIVRTGIWSESAATVYVEAGTLGLLSIGWSLWKNSKGRGKLLQALHWADRSENEVEAHIALVAPPPASTPKDVVPLPKA